MNELIIAFAIICSQPNNQVVTSKKECVAKLLECYQKERSKLVGNDSVVLCLRETK